MKDLDGLLANAREYPEEKTFRMMLVDELLENYDGTLPPIPPAVWFEIADRLESHPAIVGLWEWPQFAFQSNRFLALSVYSFLGVEIQERHVLDQRIRDNPTILDYLRPGTPIPGHEPIHVLRAHWPGVQFKIVECEEFFYQLDSLTEPIEERTRMRIPKPVTLDAESVPA